jgi:hypothetical protein
VTVVWLWACVCGKSHGLGYVVNGGEEHRNLRRRTVTKKMQRLMTGHGAKDKVMPENSVPVSQHLLGL